MVLLRVQLQFMKTILHNRKVHPKYNIFETYTQNYLNADKLTITNNLYLIYRYIQFS